MRSRVVRCFPPAPDIIPLALCLSLAGCSGYSTRTTAFPRPSITTPVQVAGPAAIIRRDIRTLRAESYSADYHTGARMPDGTVIVIFHSLCTGSTDGHCQAIDVFEGSHARPLWQHEYAGVLSINTLRAGFSIRAVRYAPRDPLCCPSLPPVTRVYIWTGSGFKERGPSRVS